MTWTPLLPARPIPKADVPDAIRKVHEDQEKNEQLFMNDIYTVSVRRYKALRGRDPDLICLSIKRNDKEAIRDWRDFQRIKNELTSPEHEGMEMYPAESRLVDTANQYYMWVIDDPKFRWPWGFKERLVSETGLDFGAKQRSWPDGEKPADLVHLDEEAFEKYSKKE